MIRVFSLETVLQKLENVTLSVFLQLHVVTKEQRTVLIYLCPLSSVLKSKVEKIPAHANRLGEFCEILAMQ